MTQRNTAAPAVATCANLLAANLLAACLLAGCGSLDDTTPTAGPQKNFHSGRDPAAESAALGGASLFSFGGNGSRDQQNGGLEVNAYLWRGALDALKFMPLASADPFGGVIITDWWTPPSSPGERFKATAYILGRQLRADGIRISLFRQVSQNGQWVDATVDPGKSTELENVVLAKARELRAQSDASG